MGWYTCKEADGDYEVRLQAYDAVQAASDFIQLADNNAGGEIGGELMRGGGYVRVSVVSDDGVSSQFDMSAEASIDWYAHEVSEPSLSATERDATVSGQGS